MIQLLFVLLEEPIAEMNLSELIDADNTTFHPFDFNMTRHWQPYVYRPTIFTLRNVVHCVCLALGVPGNVLSAIIWFRRHVTSKNSSAVYLAVLAVDDLLYLLLDTVSRIVQVSVFTLGAWFYHGFHTLYVTTKQLEPLLVLSFSVERLIVISCPLRVCCVHVYCLSLIHI